MLQFKLPSQHLPGSDRFSKLLARDQEIIDMITQSLVDTPPGTFHAEATSFIKTECDVLYVSKSDQTPIIVEFQGKVDQSFMTRAIGYCLDVTRITKQLPIILVFCLKSASRVISKTFEPSSACRPWLLHSEAATHYATEFYMVTPQSIDPWIQSSSTSNNTLDPLLALAHFFISGQPSIIGMTRWDDPSIIRLYKLAMQISPSDHKSENNRITALREMADTAEKQFEKTALNIMTDPHKSLQYAEAGVSWAKSLKRKYDRIAAASADDDGEQRKGSITPMSEPSGAVEPDKVYGSNTTTADPNALIEAIMNHVHKFMATKSGRMDWRDCYKEAISKIPNIDRHYTNASSFKATYYKNKKQQKQ